jgi:hypothetical protein
MKPEGDPPVCKCHDQPAYWNRDLRKKAGGHWRCAVKHREGARARYDADPVYRSKVLARQREKYDADPVFRAAKLAKQMARYDADPVYRIGGNLRKNAKRRAQTIARQREAFNVEYGAIAGEFVDQPQYGPSSRSSPRATYQRWTWPKERLGGRCRTA